MALDPQTLKRASNAEVTSLATAFSDVPAMNQLPVARWMSDTANLATLPTDIPLPLRQSVRLYQRAFPLGTSAPSTP